jgi:hypothetical protein
VSYTPKSIALLNEEEVAVGADNGHIHVYSLKASALTEVSTAAVTITLQQHAHTIGSLRVLYCLYFILSRCSD